MAERLGLPRDYLHDPPGKPRPHYDLTPRLREQALQQGVRELTRRELVEFLRRGRQALTRIESAP